MFWVSFAASRPFYVSEKVTLREEGKGRLVKLAGFSFAFRAKIGGAKQGSFPLRP